MKSRYTTVDLRTAIAEIQRSEAISLRVLNVYDIDNKTYLIRVTAPDKKFVILIESGNRIQLTDYDWPKHTMPSGFAMKCRKHLKGRRLAAVNQLGVDRIVDFTFGYDEAAYHLIVELYDRGNIILADHQYSILQLLRTRTDKEQDVKFAVRELYPVENARQKTALIDRDELIDNLCGCKKGEQLKRVLNPMFIYGPALLEHCLLTAGLKPNVKVGEQFDIESDDDIDKLYKALQMAESMMESTDSQREGYIIQKKENKESSSSDKSAEADLVVNVEFHPFLYEQHKTSPYKKFDSFLKAVDEFFSKLESQRIDMKALQQEKTALKKLENVRKDHEKRLQDLHELQDLDMKKAELIEINLPLVEQAIKTINSAVANQMDWEEIGEIVKEAQEVKDPVASSIKTLKLESNQIILDLRYPEVYDPINEMRMEEYKHVEKPISVEIDLGMTAFANARFHHNKRRHAAQKEQKTMDASKKALKSAERKTKETLKEVQTNKVINKTRKAYWFEKYYWFISSENYLVIAGRDQQQNEIIVKRYLRPGDVYVHADLHGASSVIVKNNNNTSPIPPKTLNEAGTMAVCYSAAWDAKIITSAWWVHHDQVSKTAPSGEYLTTGSFMIRGKKNYLPHSYLIMGYGLLFRVEESCIANHMNERQVRTVDDDQESVVTDVTDEVEQELVIEEGDEEDVDDKNDGDKNSSDPVPADDNFGDSGQVEDPNDTNMDSIKNGHDDHENMNENGINEEDMEEIKEENLDEDNVVEENMFPDTSIQLQHVSGGTFQLHRGISASVSEASYEGEENFVYLGDGEKVDVRRPQVSENRKPKLSAKQRRDMKKKKQAQQVLEEEDVKEEDVPKIEESIEKMKIENSSPKRTNNPTPPKQEPAKRGQKSKQKKQKQKYKDQDDEDRELMQQLLQSSNPEKPPKKKGKDKAKQQQQQQRQQQKPKPKPTIDPLAKPEDIILSSLNDSGVTSAEKPVVDDDADDVQEDPSNDQMTVLNALTGCPIADDLLLYAIPFCAPYASMQNYKYKVKVTPGTGKRGKAAKTAVHLFQMSKEASEREKDLCKSLKDVDISRNLPGKVKVSAPNLQKAKKK